jgi:hypothetical protein
MPLKKEVWQLHNNKEVFELMFNKFLPALIGCVKHKNSRGVKMILEKCTKSSEAFCCSCWIIAGIQPWTVYAENTSKNQEEEALTEMPQDDNMEHLAPVPNWMVGVYCHGRNPAGWSQEAAKGGV